jgi:hypothetical protein
MIYDIICIGYGIATMSFLLQLTGKIQKPTHVLVIDEYFDGGDLRRLYSKVRSNTTWSQFLEAVEPFCASAHLRELHDPASTTPLEEIVFNFQKILKSTLPLSQLNIHYKTLKVQSISYQNSQWKCHGETAKIAIICTGSDPRSLNYPKPTLQLHSVLNNTHICRPGDHVLVFGTAHSGTLAIKTLADHGASVTAIHTGDQPFKFARDGEYDGIKQESAIIADNIINGIIPNVKLISCKNEDAIRSALIECDWILYTCGFERRNNIKICTGINDSIIIDTSKYDATTGKICPDLPLFGYGIAFPNSNDVNGKKFYDVSLPAFMSHISKNITHVTNLL